MRNASRVLLGALLASASGLAGGNAHAEASQSATPIAFRSSVPEGFAALSGPQTAVVDIYFGGKRVGDARVSYQSGTLAFEDPTAVASILPKLSDPAAVITALSQKGLPSNAQLRCVAEEHSESCGRLQPDVVGVIFNEARFRLDLFVNPRFLAVQGADDERYLPAPQGGVSLVNSIGMVASGAVSGPRFYNVQDQLILGDADRRIRADLGYASGFGFQADRLAVEVDKPGWRYTAGAFWTPGSDLIGRRRIFGVGIQTQVDTRIDKDQINGQPLVVFLNQRSRVDIVRDGRVIASRVYEGGNQKLDTASLPSGSYDVVLRITEAGGATHEERRFFSRNQSVPAQGERVLYAYAGVLGDNFSRGFLTPTSTPFAQVGGAVRISPRFALDATGLATDRAGLAQIGVNYLHRLANLRLAGIASTDGLRGGLVQLSSSGTGRLNFNFDLRRMSVGKAGNIFDEANSASGPQSYAGSGGVAGTAASHSFTQLSGNLSFTNRALQILANGSYRRDKAGQKTYSYGPAVRWEVLRRGAMRLSVQGDVAFTEKGRSSFAGLSLQIVGRRSSVSATGGYRRSSEVGPDTAAAVASLQAATQFDHFAGGEMSAAASVDRDVDRKLANVSLDYRGPSISASADAIHNFGEGPERTQYSLGLQTTLVAGGGTFGLQGREQTESQVVVAVDGSGQQQLFDVLVNDGAAGQVRSGEALALGLVSYRQYEVRIRPSGNAGPLLYDGQARKVSLYPGTVTRLEWTTARLVSVFGRLVDPLGNPIANAAIAAPGGIAQSDNHGYFQMDVSEGAQLEVTVPGSGHCTLSMPSDTDSSEEMVRLGDLTCATIASGRLMAQAGH